MQQDLVRSLTRLYVRKLFPWVSTPLSVGRRAHHAWQSVRERMRARPRSSKSLPDAYCTHNDKTRDGVLELSVLGELPADLDGSLYVAQSLGMATNFQCGDVNIARLDLAAGRASLKNKRFEPPAVLARDALRHSPYAMNFFGYMHWSFCVGAQAYAEGMWIMPDGQIAVTSDVERPYLIDPRTLEVTTALGERHAWLSFAPEPMASMIGKLFPLVNNSQGLFVDHDTREVFMADFRVRLSDPAHPARLLRFTGERALDTFELLTATGEPLEITQNLHELVGTREHVVLVDTGFATGNDIFFPWLDLPKPKPKTAIHIVRRGDLSRGATRVRVTSVEVDLPAIHLFADYECPDERITLYLLHTPFTNVADIVRPEDVDVEGRPFPAHVVGYGTLPPMDVSAIGKHVIDVKRACVAESRTVRDAERTFAPYMFTLPRRQSEHFHDSHAFVMFRGFSRDLLPKRVADSFAADLDRVVPLEQLIGPAAKRVLGSLCKVDCASLEIVDSYVFAEKTLCFTLCTLDSSEPGAAGYLLAAVVTDQPASAASNGHEYWLFRADALAEGPRVKLVHRELYNNTLFHPVYVRGGPATLEARAVDGRYHLPIREDYPDAEIALYPERVQQVFREQIYPRFERRQH